jgi:C-terminal processing protease CtpA/Prc
MNLKTTLLIIAISLLSAMTGSYLVSRYQNNSETKPENANSTYNKNIPNPFSATGNNDNEQLRIRIENLESVIFDMNNKIEKLQDDFDSLNASKQQSSRTSSQEPVRQLTGFRINRRLYNVDNLVKNGIDPTQAEDIVRRKNQVELQRLELQDKAQREGYLNTDRFYNEMAEIDARDVDLRTELGDDRYDHYLYDSKMHNRVRITSVIIGSEAERAGIEQNDIIVSYNNKRVFTWDELKKATSEGKLGEYVPMVIDRNGDVFSVTVPRGPLGVQLGAARSEP